MSNSQGKVEDRISELPDELLCKILSCWRLDTKFAVRTSVLSPRWKYVWTSLPKLQFCDYEFEGDYEAFMTFVDRILSLRDSSDIKTFYFECEAPKVNDHSRIESWICTAIRRNVVELDLSVDMNDIAKSFELPQSIFTCKTLEVLRLMSNFNASPPKSGCFPCLKVLDVRVYYPNCDNSSVGQIFSNCPVLEDLRIRGDLGDGFEVLEFNISAPQLKRLTLSLYIEYFKDDKYMFYINAPKLEVFDFFDGDSSVFSFEMNAKSLFKANVRLSSCCRHVDGTNGLLEAISCVKQLSLSTLNLEGGVPAFDNLNNLDLSTLCDSTCWRNLMEFLKRSRNLEHLVIKNNDVGECKDFTPPEFVPVCMVSHLKTITIRCFEARQDEMRVAQYLDSVLLTSALCWSA